MQESRYVAAAGKTTEFEEDTQAKEPTTSIATVYSARYSARDCHIDQSPTNSISTVTEDDGKTILEFVVVKLERVHREPQREKPKLFTGARAAIYVLSSAEGEFCAA